MTDFELAQLESYMQWVGGTKEYRLYHDPPLTRDEGRRLILKLIESYRELATVDRMRNSEA